MTDEEKEVYQFLKDWQFYVSQISQFQRKSKDMRYRTTAAYNAISVNEGGGFNSKVENTALKLLEYSNKAREYMAEIEVYRRAFTASKLTDDERKVVIALTNGETLLQVARRNNIRQNEIYKLRDSAIIEITRQRNELKRRKNIDKSTF